MIFIRTIIVFFINGIVKKCKPCITNKVSNNCLNMSNNNTSSETQVEKKPDREPKSEKPKAAFRRSRVRTCFAMGALVGGSTSPTRVPYAEQCNRKRNFGQVAQSKTLKEEYFFGTK